MFVYLYDGNKVDGIKPENCPKMLRDINSVEMFISYITAAKYYGKTNIFNDGCSILDLFRNWTKYVIKSNLLNLELYEI
ncbi:hypothetical protein [Candidatus Trichorickettsia mobilis]|uniref:hypothetical protein n=1 Tax=Candidatus Trichorickettsia mobilis TaxID=1346319 RepID=UPI00292EF38F|nr:hypothetical protein [Candidatus Trichorickettsia mobilis]